MRALFTKIQNLELIPVDFLLIPLGIVFFEISVLISDVLRSNIGTGKNDFLVHLIHFLLLILFAYTGKKFLESRNIFDLKFSGLLIFGIIFGIYSEFIFNVLNETFNTSHQRGIGLAVRSVLFLGIIWFPLAVIAGVKFRRIPEYIYGFEKTLLINARIKLRESLEFRESSKEIESAIIERLTLQTDLLAKDIARINQEFSAPNAAAIQQLLKENKLRKLSAELENAGSKKHGNSKWSSNLTAFNIFARQIFVFLKASLQTGEIPINLIILLFGFGTLPSLINTLPISRSLPAIIVMLLLVYLVIKVPIWITKENQLPKVSWILLSYFLLCYIPLISNVISQWLFPYPGGHAPYFITVINFPVLFAIELVIAQLLIPILSHNISNLAYEPSHSIIRLKLHTIHSEQEARLAHQWAVFIHGKILTRFATNSLRIQQAVDNNDADAYKKLRQSIMDLLANPTAEFQSSTNTLSEELSSRIDPWFGILEVKLNLSPDLQNLQNERIQEVGEVVEEILSNSVRHGGATELALNIKMSEDETLVIEVKDNALVSPDPEKNIPGLGTKIFNLVSDGRWEIGRIGFVTIFKIQISLQSKVAKNG